MMRKLFTFLLIGQLLFLQSLPLAWADITPTPTDTPTPTSAPTDTSTPTVTPTNTPTPDNTSPSSSTGSATVSPTPAPALDLTATNSGSVSTNASSSATSGDNTIATASADVATPSADTNNPTNTDGSNQQQNNQHASGNTQNASITTGNAVAVTSAENDVNTTSVNSQFVNQTINVYMTQNQNLDLSIPLNIVSQLITKDNNTSPQINILINNNSYAVVSNNIVNQAVSGQNSASGSGQMVIDTGNAYSAVSLTNKVNFTIVNSVVHVITINIFGTLNGNIILPDLQNPISCSGCGLTAGVGNSATVDNVVTSNAVSGNNTITLLNANATGSAAITTGNAASVVNVNNLVNTNAIGVSLEHLFINTFGQWNGKFLGWGVFGAQNGGQSYTFNGTFDGGNANCPNCLTTVSTSNSATVTNNISSLANSGNNVILGGSGNITTGHAYSVVQLLNFVNANFIRTYGFFGFINIFGNFNGNIGDAQSFITPTPTPSPSSIIAATNSSSVACTTSGDPKVSTSVSDNIATFINPGDTALFFVHVNNTGPNDFTSEKVTIALSVGGKTIGGTILHIQKPLASGKGELVTVGLGLSKLAPGGQYTATVTTQGITCDNKTATATAAVQFVVSGAVLGAAAITTPTPTPIVAQKVLGAHTVVASTNKYNWLIYALLLIVLAYLIIRGIRSRAMLLKLVRENMTIKERLATLRLLLL